MYEYTEKYHTKRTQFVTGIGKEADKADQTLRITQLTMG